MDPNSPFGGSIPSTNAGYRDPLDSGIPGFPKFPPDLIQSGASLQCASRGTICFMVIRRTTLMKVMLQSADPVGYIPYVQAYGWVYCTPDSSRDQLPDLDPQEYAAFFPAVGNRQPSNINSPIPLLPRLGGSNHENNRGGGPGFRQGQI